MSKAVSQVQRAELAHENLSEHTRNAGKNLPNSKDHYKGRPDAFGKKVGELETLRSSAQSTRWFPIRQYRDEDQKV